MASLFGKRFLGFLARYRQLYNDILVSGARRFAVVAPHPTEENRLAEVGRKKMREMNEQKRQKDRKKTNNRWYYTSTHKIIEYII